MFPSNLQRFYFFAARTMFALFVAVGGFQTAVYASKPTCNGVGAVASPGCVPLYFFQGGSDGGDPVGGLTLGPNGALYGTTNGGGVNSGTVFELMPPTPAGGLWKYTLLYSFGTAANDGRNPQAPLVIDKNGVLYGTTPQGGGGGCVGGSGVVFQLAPPAALGGTWTYSILYSFLGGSDGCIPWYSGVVIGSNGALYGTTAQGGGSANCPGGCGTVFELSPPASPGSAWTESVLHKFTGGNGGAAPQANVLIGNGGVLYGTTYTGGHPACGSLSTEGCGVVFELKPKATGGAWTESVLYSFTGGNDGGLSSAPLVLKSGSLYGTTSQEDSYYQNGGDCMWGCGTVFELTAPASAGAAWKETVLYHFLPGGPPQGTCPAVQCDASDPVGGVVFGPNGSLYGTTAQGGPFATGTIFELTPPASAGAAWTEAVLFDTHFVGPGYTSFPASPFAGLTVGKNGVLYGTTTGDAGMVYQLKP